MKKSYLFYLWQYIKSALLIITMYSILIILPIINEGDDILIMGIIGLIIYFFVLIIALSSIPIILSSLIRYLLPKHIYLSAVISALIFLGYGFILNKNVPDYKEIILKFFNGLLLPVLSEIFIYLSLKRAQKKQSIKENQE